MVHVNGNVNRRHARSHRRLRPGMHERRSLDQKVGLPFDVEEGVSIARDTSILLPTEWAKPSPLRRQTFEQSWVRWKAREAEVKAEKEREVSLRSEREEREMREMFGGDVGDDELRSLGILYDSEPEYAVRYVPSRHRRRNANQVPLQLQIQLASSLLSESPDIARFMAKHENSIHTIQHRTVQTPPLSLPPLSESISSTVSSGSRSASPLSFEFPIAPISVPVSSPAVPVSDENDLSWDFIHRAGSAPHTPISEPETWILLGDDS